MSCDGVQRPIRARVATGSGTEQFWAFVDFDSPSAPRRVSLALRARFDDGCEVWEALGDVDVVIGGPPSRPRPDPSVDGRDAEPLIAICMATYEPDLELLRHQIASIRAQRYTRWVAFVSDDSSSAVRRADLTELVGADQRFQFVPHTNRVGAYGNFERVLERVPASVSAIALCDQDDIWRPDKLARLASVLERRETGLVYSDARIVDRHGHVQSTTFWTTRKHRAIDLESLLIANAVPGCTALWSADLLPIVLPFPPAIDGVFHDQWIACVAAATGRIDYVGEALIDYVQHAANAFGHAASVDPTTGQRARSELRAARRDVGINSVLKAREIDFALRGESLARTLQLRLEHVGLPSDPALRRASDGEAITPRILRHGVRAARACALSGLPGVELAAARGLLAARDGGWCFSKRPTNQGRM